MSVVVFPPASKGTGSATNGTRSTLKLQSGTHDGKPWSSSAGTSYEVHDKKRNCLRVMGKYILRRIPYDALFGLKSCS
jgi:hypothetical protein